MNQRVQSYLDFAVKVFIVAFTVFLLVFALVMQVFNPLFDKISNNFDNMAVRVNTISNKFEDTMRHFDGLAKMFEGNETFNNVISRAYGMTTNPETLYQIALLKEEQGDLAGAVKELSLAIGLVAPDVELYRTKLNELKDKLSANN